MYEPTSSQVSAPAKLPMVTSNNKFDVFLHHVVFPLKSRCVCWHNIGLYRDDGLAAFDKTPREIENIKKYICTTFSEHNLKLTIEANKKRVDYLDITLDLISESYKPFMKPGNVPQYVHRNSNHPPPIIRSIPENINTRLSNISSDKSAFDSAIPPYQEALKRSGYDYNLNYKPHQPKPKRLRTRNVTWFNPPYNASVSTNIGSKFLRIIDKCFPPSHPLRKICSRNTLKLSYSCMPNVATIISSHNKRLLTETQPSTTFVENCNCRNNNHTNSFRNPKHKNRTALTKYIWKLKDSKIDFAVSWKIIKKCRGYSSHTKKCNLCLHEKYLIICHPKLSSLNSRNELVSSCRYRRKHLLSNYFNDL